MFSMSRVLMTETSDMKITTFLFLDELFDDPDYPVHNFEALPLITLQKTNHWIFPQFDSSLALHGSTVLIFRGEVCFKKETLI